MIFVVKFDTAAHNNFNYLFYPPVCRTHALALHVAVMVTATDRR